MKGQGLDLPLNWTCGVKRADCTAESAWVPNLVPTLRGQASEKKAANPFLMGSRATGATGLEPATSGVTGRRSNQLSYAPERLRDGLWGSPGGES
jgi:hypothetical protein